MATKLPKRTANSEEIQNFLQKIEKTPVVRVGQQKGRVIFAMDATASREQLWDIASHQHAAMFNAVGKADDLSVQLSYYRGFNEFHASNWSQSPASLQREIVSVRCLAGRTQIARVLRHTISEAKKNTVSALVFVGDCFEESIDKLGDLAGQLGILRVPIFVFQEGNDATASRGFYHLAKLSGGAHCHFDVNSAEQLGQLLSAVATYATGGKAALKHLENKHSHHIKALLEQLKD